MDQTAFLVSRTKLLTAAHSRLQAGQRIDAQKSGSRYVSLNDEEVFNGASDMEVWDLGVVRNFYEGGQARWTDLAILETLGVRNRYWVPLDFDATFSEGMQVDIIGYPGRCNRDRLLLTQSEINGSNTDQAEESAKELLPEGVLSVSGGEIIADGLNPTYRISTTHGMSGTPFAFNGKVVSSMPSIILTDVQVYT